jgi:hypothetical protein
MISKGMKQFENENICLNVNLHRSLRNNSIRWGKTQNYLRIEIGIFSTRNYDETKYVGKQMDNYVKTSFLNFFAVYISCWMQVS